MNFVLAFFIFLVVGLASGVPNTESSEIGGLTEGYGAASVLQVGDVITKLNDTEINSWTDISTYLNSQLGAEEVSVTFERNGETKTGVIKTTNVSYRLGVTNKGEYVENGLKVYMVFDNNYVAGKAGLQNGDILLGYYDNDTYIPFTSWKELYDLLDSDPNMDSLKIKYAHDGVEKETTSDVWTERSINEIASGINANTQIGISGTTRFDFFGGIGNAFVLFWNSITTVFVTLGALFSNSQIDFNDIANWNENLILNKLFVNKKAPSWCFFLVFLLCLIKGF